METIFVRDCSDETELCPFCANSDNPHRTLMAIKLADLIHYVKCESCAARGPVDVEFPSDSDAIDAWNWSGRDDDKNQI